MKVLRQKVLVGLVNGVIIEKRNGVLLEIKRESHEDSQNSHILEKLNTYYGPARL